MLFFKELGQCFCLTPQLIALLLSNKHVPYKLPFAQLISLLSYVKLAFLSLSRYGNSIQSRCDAPTQRNGRSNKKKACRKIENFHQPARLKKLSKYKIQNIWQTSHSVFSWVRTMDRPAKRRFLNSISVGMQLEQIAFDRLTAKIYQYQIRTLVSDMSLDSSVYQYYSLCFTM